jgi:hypothetical protein
MSYLFIKNRFQREKFVFIFIKNQKIKKTHKTPQKKTFLVGFLCGFFWFFLGGWVFYCQPCLEAATRRTPPGSWLLECDRPGEETRRLKGTVSRDRISRYRIYHFLSH